MGYEARGILETERLLFRQHTIADMEAYCAMEMDPDVRRYVGERPRLKEEAENKFMKQVQPITNNLGLWAMIFKPESCYIGRCGLYPHFKQDGSVFEGEASIGYYLAKAYWGRGLATEASGAFVQFGFNKLKLDRIVTTIDARHDVSVHIIRKLGFVLTTTETGSRLFYHFALKNPGHDN